MSDPTPSDDNSALLNWLAHRDVPCPLCNYNLRALTTPRYPECGNDLRLSVSLTDPYIKAWITLATAVCGSAGTGILFFFIFLKEGLPHEGFPVDGPFIYFMLTIPIPVILLKTRRRYQRLPRTGQWTISLIVVAITSAAMAILCAALQ